MKERRKFNRLATQKGKFLKKDGAKDQENALLDISPSGMRVLLGDDLKIGTSIFGQFQIFPDCGNFYVCGEVMWVKPAQEPRKNANFEVGVKFNKVSAVPL